MYRGVSTINLDAKGRMAVPTKYRETLVRQCDSQMVVTVDRDSCLLLYPLGEWEDIERKLVRLPSFNKQARSLQRLLIGHATECELDSAGRILVPPLLREFAGMEKTVVLIGQGNKFEIWAEGKWNESRSEWLEAEGEDGGPMPDELGSLSL